MSVITNILGESSFELIRSRIAAILADELANQRALNVAALEIEEAKPSPDPELVAFYELNISAIPSVVWEERFRSPSPAEMPVLNVIMASNPLSDLTTNSTQIDIVKYSLEAYYNSADKDENRGDYLASIKLQRILGICRKILMDRNYITLGFNDAANNQPNILGGREVSNILIGQPDESARDANNTIVGKFDINVKAFETVGDLSGIEIALNTTVVKLYDTENGFSWTNTSN